MRLLEKLCESLGKANLPVYTVAAVAVFKGILRPTFTMMDKNQNPQTKKYAAVKEGTTELIAIPTYIGMSWLTQKLAPAFSPKGKNFDQILGCSKSTLGFFGVCIAALYVIPKLCNVAMPHVMKILGVNKHPKNDIPNETVVVPNIENPQVQSLQPIKSKNLLLSYTPAHFNGGMKI